MTVTTRRPLTADEIAAYGRDGFVLLPGFFDADEIAPIAEACRADPSLGGCVIEVVDSDGAGQEMASWKQDGGDDLLSLMPRIARIVCGAEALIGEPVYHWHSKLTLKRPDSPGRWDWHQDFGSWYKEGCLRPAMITCGIAVEACDEDNGCLKLIRGSHLFGRLDHVRIGASQGADPARVERALEQFEVVSCLMAPGDALFFHANTLHASGPNRSPRPRTLLHCSYNAIANEPRDTPIEGHRYTPLTKAPDAAIRDGAWSAVFEPGRFSRPRPGGPYGYTVRRAG